jgi:hypothetical protein
MPTVIAGKEDSRKGWPPSGRKRRRPLVTGRSPRIAAVSASPASPAPNTTTTPAADLEVLLTLDLMVTGSWTLPPRTGPPS